MAEKDGAQGDHIDDGQGDQAVEVDGKTYTADDVKGLLSQAKTVTEKSQLISQVGAFAEKYGLEPEDVLANAEGAFTVVNTLIGEKVIDNEGKLIVKEQKKEEAKDDDAGLKDLFDGKDGDKKVDGLTAKDVQAIVGDALKTELGTFSTALKDVSDVQTGMIRQQYEEKLSAKFPDLTPDDISKTFAAAMGDKTKTLWQHAEIVSTARATEKAAARAENAKEFGIDLEKFDENKLEEQEAEGGAMPMPKGKKISWRPGKDHVSPGDAAATWLDKQG